MKFGIIVFPGSNCDHDTYHVIKHILGTSVEFLWHKERDLRNADVIILPGGFSYGDYLRAGAIARFSPIMQEVVAFAQKGGLILGICNGFQILIESGLLPGALITNNHMKFRCQEVFLRAENVETAFTSEIEPGEVLKMPIAHHAGNYYVSEELLQELEENQQIAFRYCSPTGEVIPEFNPNGAIGNIAGIFNRSRNVLGMMPHPERASEDILGSSDGLKIFNSLLKRVSYAI